jgi:hypothetical protein
MTKINFPIGNSNFADIRANDYYYVDKSGIIKELLSTEGTQITLITRPRRFGKTLVMTMLAEFFDITKDSRSYFAGLNISKDTEIIEKWLNKWPVVYVSLKDVSGIDFNQAYGMLKNTISDLFIKNYYLKDSDKVNEIDKKVFLEIADKVEGRPSDDQIKTSLALLMRMLKAHYGRPVILLIDEYDVPLAKASEDKEHYKRMLDIMKAMLSSAIKDNQTLKLGVITGCLRIAKESIFTGTNNFVSDTISDTRLNEYFGFTQSEVDKILTEAKLEYASEEIKKWYDGYHFGEFDVYCPWNVMNYINSLQNNPKAKPVGYWKNSSDNMIIRSFIDYAKGSITGKIETLLAGESIIEHITEDLTYQNLHESEDNLWSILYLTGYLTIEKKEASFGLSENYRLKIPNLEVKTIFEDTIKKWFEDSAKTWDRKKLFGAVWNGNDGVITDEITKLLRKTISYYDYKEDFYHAFLVGIFAGAGYAVESNKEQGEGRSDILIRDFVENKAVVFEVKCSKKVNELETDCERALKQIKGKMYGVELIDEGVEVKEYGISFWKKRCIVKGLK